MSDEVVLAAGQWRTNAELTHEPLTIQLGEQHQVADVTYGAGNWWSDATYRLIDDHSSAVEMPDRRTGPDFDFRATGFANDSYDIVLHDPPYVARGGRSTSGIDKMNEAYGLIDAPSSPAELPGLRILRQMLLKPQA